MLKQNKVRALMAVDETPNNKYVNNMFQLVLSKVEKKKKSRLEDKILRVLFRLN